MKKINIILTGALMLAGLCSCSDFLTREPIHKFSAETYFSSEAELEMYANGMLKLSDRQGTCFFPGKREVDASQQ